jgi:quercetin dioxygenase-like cupin family protein
MNKFFLALVSVLIIGFAQQSVSQQPVIEAKMTVHDLFGMEPRGVMEGIKARGIGAATVRMARIEVETGHSTPDHNHPDEEIILLLEGRIKGVSGDEEFFLEPGEVIVIPAYVQHHYEAIESSVTIEVFGPGTRSFNAETGTTSP